MKDLTKAHEQHLLPIIRANEDDEEQTVEILTENIQTVYIRFTKFSLLQLFRNAQEKTKRVAMLQVKPQEQTVKKNVQNFLALQLQGLASQFRNAQKDYLGSENTHSN